MGSSTVTPNLNLPIFDDADRPTWRGDINGAFRAIDADSAAKAGQIGTKENSADLTKDVDAHLYATSNTYYVASYPGATISDQIAATFKAATANASYDTNAIIQLPAGKFAVRPNVFSSWVGQAGVRRGLIIRGAGEYATQLTLTTSGVSSWFYDNGATDVGQFWRFEDMMFLTDDVTNTFGNFMRITGRGNEQNFVFKNCAWDIGFTRIFDTEGLIGDDSIRTYNCHMRGAADCAWYLNNPQSVLHENFGLNAEAMTGDLVRVGPNGGGDVKFYGGSLIMLASPTAGKQTWLVNVDNSSAGSGTGNSWFGFYGCRTELHTQTNGYVYSVGNGSFTHVAFIGGNYSTASGTTTHDMIHLGLSKTVTFSDARLSTSANIVFDVDNASESALVDPVVRFARCGIAHDQASQVSYVGGKAYGRVVAEGCYAIGYDHTAPIAMDFDLNASTSLAGGAGTKKKIAVIKSGLNSWPNSVGNEATIMMPPSAFITRIYVNMPAAGSSGATYQLAVGNGDKTVTYGSGTSGQMRYGQTIDVSPNLFTGTDTNSRTMRLFAPAAGDATNMSGGIAYVEYI
jgi:hypothetical protein